MSKPLPLWLYRNYSFEFTDDGRCVWAPSGVWSTSVERKKFKINKKKSTDSKSILSNSAEQDQNNWFAHDLFISGDDFSFYFFKLLCTHCLKTNKLKQNGTI